MDMFTDKLAEKLAAQEIISANSAADAEQINRLKNQIVEYDECLSKLRNLIEDGANQLQTSKADSADINRLVEESIGKIREMQQDAKALEEFAHRLEDRIDKINSGIDDNVHRECVKVYRNVQAVVNEENEKEVKAKEALTTAVNKMGKKLVLVLGFSAVAAVCGIAAFVLQLLTILHVI